MLKKKLTIKRASVKESIINLQNELVRSPVAGKQFLKTIDEFQKLDLESAITASVATTAVILGSCAYECQLKKSELNELLRTVAASMKATAHEIAFGDV